MNATWITRHAVKRYMERIRPGADEREGFAVLRDATDRCKRAGRTPNGQAVWIVDNPAMRLVTKHDTTLGRMILVTVLWPDGPAIDDDSHEAAPRRLTLLEAIEAREARAAAAEPPPEPTPAEREAARVARLVAADERRKAAKQAARDALAAERKATGARQRAAFEARQAAEKPQAEAKTRAGAPAPKTPPGPKRVARLAFAATLCPVCRLAPCDIVSMWVGGDYGVGACSTCSEALEAAWRELGAK